MGVGQSWPSTGDLSPKVSVQTPYTVQITLTRRIDDPDDLDEVVVALTGRLSLPQLRLDQDHQGRTRLVLTLEATDLWQAILLTMNAVTSTGYAPVAVAAEPAAP